MTALSARLQTGQPGADIDWRRLSLVTVFATAESIVFWLLIAVLMATEAVPLAIPPLVVWMLMAGSSLIPVVLDECEIWDPWSGVAMIGGAIMSTAVAIKVSAFPEEPWLTTGWLRAALDDLLLRESPARVAVWAVVIVSALAWWRGRTRSEPTLDAAHNALHVGLVVLTILSAMQLLRQLPEHREIVSAIVLFFVVALAGVAMARGAGDPRESDRDAIRTRRSTSWGPLLAMLLIVGPAVIVGLALTPGSLDRVWYLIAPLIWAISILLQILVIVAAGLAFLAVSPILLLLQGRQIGPLYFPDLTFGPSNGEEAGEGARRTLDSPDPIRLLIVLAVLALLFGGITRITLRRRYRLGTETDSGTRSIDFSWPAWPWHRWRPGLRRRGADGDPLAVLRNDPRWAATVTIRETYGRLLRRLGERGLARREGETTRRHLERVVGASGLELAAIEDWRSLQRAYEQIRYTGQPATTAEADQARERWRRLEPHLRRTKS